MANICLLVFLLQLPGSNSFGQYSLLQEKQTALNKVSVNGLVEKWNRVRLQTLDGKLFKPSTLHKRLTAVVFLSPECPLCQNYTLVLNKLQTSFRNELDIAGVFPGKSVSPSTCESFRNKYQIRFLLLTDKSKSLVKILEGRITPEVFLVDEQRNVLYRGAIDNWVTALGKQRNKTTENYLEDAIRSYLAGETIKITQVNAIGCLITDR